MRPLGLSLAVLLAASAVLAQGPGAPGQPPGGAGVPVGPGVPQPAAPPPAAQPDPKLNAHLDGWEQKMRGLVNFRAEFSLTRKEAVFQKAREYAGVVLCMKPNFAILRLDNTQDPTKSDYEAFICNGRAVYEYNGLRKEVTEIPLPPNAGAGASDNLMLDFLSGMSAQAAKARFQISLFNEDANYVYLDVKPVQPKDLQEFQQVRFALYGPNVKAPHTPYLPVQAWVLKPNQDTELWKFTKLEMNLPGIDQKVFQYSEIKGFAFKKLPPPGPPARPGGNPPPGPGAVRP